MSQEVGIALRSHQAVPLPNPQRGVHEQWRHNRKGKQQKTMAAPPPLRTLGQPQNDKTAALKCRKLFPKGVDIITGEPKVGIHGC